MSIKTLVVSKVRRMLPQKAVRLAEEAYRRGRVRLVSFRYGNPAKNLRVIAVTGTNGKTTTVSYINEILKAAKLKTAMFSTAVIEVDGKSEINDLNATVASTVRMQKFFQRAKKAKVDYVVLEITSHALHQHKLAGVPIEAAIMTNLTHDHLDYHKTMQNYAEAKGKMFAMNPKIMILNRDDEWFEFFDQYKARNQKLTYGEHKEADVKIEKVSLSRNGSEVQISVGKTTYDLSTVLPGKYNVYNMTAAVSLAHAMELKEKDIRKGVENLQGVPGRFERVVEGKDYDVIVDYAHTPDALEKLLQAAKAVTKNRVILVFGATGDRDKGKRPVMGKIASKYVQKIFLTDEEAYSEDPVTVRAMVLDGIKDSGGMDKTIEIADRREAISKALSIAKKGDTILVTGLGHEKFRVMNEGKIAWNDSDVVREILESKKV